MEENDCFIQLKKKITERTAKVGVIGLGYAGLPLAMELMKKGYTVTGIDINRDKLESYRHGKPTMSGVPSEEMLEAVKNGKLIFSEHFEIVNQLDSLVICVPTPLTDSQEPDVSMIKETVKHIRKHDCRGKLLILESTSYPGTTEELIEQKLSEDGLSAGKDYFLCFSPERIDPANSRHIIKNTPKIIGGITDRCTELAMCLYKDAIDTLVPVSSPKIAEMAKLLENTFRSINIGFVNEMALLAENLEVDIWEAIEAASTKPFGFMPFMPGPGPGGHCIPVDPVYLSWKGKSVNFHSRYIDLAQDINRSMPARIVNKTEDVLKKHATDLNGANILILGMAYKPDTNDYRESPSLKIYESLEKMGAAVSFNDPHIPQLSDLKGRLLVSEELNSRMLSDFNCVLLLTNHSAYDYKWLAEHAKLIIDTRNAFKEAAADNIITVWGKPFHKGV
ncbi:nucleotide sugar dehydrogenase [Salipaludibacillus aurantiacus]|uniref:UDP-N-acetyl-D-glucosamine dehydrogenase n=1 Tax=Salipaludibacillus aurantiacus TaxID=1601833 RepID=A0A1H9S7Y6_9BACI|nr:nucleotide sugar dehydrogenase [Salipaludibacillus aurantiacus]SER81110.1 UDP-N-acetyl-D-glucosamine dehydrogenase [Salipaludibacillus aurantiacus]